MDRAFDRIVRFFSGAIARIFGPTDDNYPQSGVQPFEGERLKRSDRKRLHI
jgi:hypothetical protein